MENASKALLIAAGILIGIMVLSLAMVGYKQVSDYYTSKEKTKQFEQLDAFNKQYTPYYRDDVRGSDLLSLINRILDFNRLNSDEDPITITIQIPNTTKTQSFYYAGTPESEKIIRIAPQKYTHENINAQLLGYANEIESTYTQALATKLSANITTLMGENRYKTPKEFLGELKIEASDYGGLETIQIDTLRYYQYQQFKRAHFDCESLIYNDEGRVKNFTFKFNGTFE